MKTRDNVSAPTDVESLRRLSDAARAAMTARLTQLLVGDAPMLPQEDQPIEKFVTVSINEGDRALIIQMGYVKFTVRFKTSVGGIRVHHNSHRDREDVVFQVAAHDAETNAMRARFRVIIMKTTATMATTRWQQVSTSTIGLLVTALVEVYRRFVLESPTLDSEISGVTISRSSIAIKYNIKAEVSHEEH